MKLFSESIFRKGFTLIELVVVIAILAILLTITLIAINPARQFALANDTQRGSDVNAILNAINQYSSDEKGQLPGDGLGPGGTDLITTTPRNISSTDANLCSILVTKYIAALPGDPTTGSGTPVTDCTQSYDTNYTVVKSGGIDARITVSATGQMTTTISATR
jgi:prepilin-type N-terminal cleavage/methylation domain-containing protein